MRSVVFALLVLNSMALLAQRPTHVPGPQGPVRFFETPANIIMYIVLPLAILVFYLMWQKWLRKNQRDKDKEGKG